MNKSFPCKKYRSSKTLHASSWDCKMLQSRGAQSEIGRQGGFAFIGRSILFPQNPGSPENQGMKNPTRRQEMSKYRCESAPKSCCFVCKTRPKADFTRDKNYSCQTTIAPAICHLTQFWENGFRILFCSVFFFFFFVQTSQRCTKICWHTCACVCDNLGGGRILQSEWWEKLKRTFELPWNSSLKLPPA